MPKVKSPRNDAPPEKFYVDGDPVPPVSLIPRPPRTYKKTAANLRGIKPRSSELVLINKAVEELRAFDDYAKVFGQTAPSYDGLLATLDRAAQWSTMRVALSQWDGFCAVMEGMAWKDSRTQLATLRPAFELADVADPSLSIQHVHLSMLVRAMKAIVRKGAATKKANREAVKQGREPLRGKALRAARRAAEKAALVEEQKKAATQARGKVTGAR